MKRLSDSPLGSRIATVHNGSALFTGNAGGGASNIRRYLIENDYLEAIIQLPNNIFYNTGITTYIWVLSNHKAKERQGKVQLIDASQLYEKLRKNLGEKNCAFTQAHIDQITKAYLDLLDTGKASLDGLKAQVFPNNEFGYWKITVERPLRKSSQFTADRIATLRFVPALSTEMEWMWQQWGEKVYDKGFLATQKETLEHWLEKEQLETSPANKKKLLDTTLWTARRDLMQAAEKLHAHLGEATSDDFNAFSESTKAAAKKLKLDLKPADLKAILDAVSWRDPAAKPVLKSGPLSPLSGQASEPHTGLCGPLGSHYEPDSELRDTENVPLTYPGGIAAYFQKEVFPHVPDAWVDEEKTVIGYEISFNKYFYQHQPLRPLEDVVAEIRQLETETEGLLEQILKFN